MHGVSPGREAYHPLDSKHRHGTQGDRHWWKNRLSPDGAWIAFLSPAETGEAHAARVREKDDAKVYGESFIAVEVCNDIDTHMDVVECSTDGSAPTSVDMLETDDNAVWFSAWDVRRVVDVSGEDSYIFASILSSVIRHEPLSAYSIRVDSKGHDSGQRTYIGRLRMGHS
ncbi:hypothetical protein B0H14DRAFT_3586374 [Mycena olivaceomarginata]|nr:hypothetical protein B0H14DRAFT_3586374 [Mycena olivaceomarginata]